ncbi:MAG: AraC family transcriptional regulator [Clostridia bacterium]|nr:AraC family transcriptional regulator [Clostridia bacterium]
MINELVKSDLITIPARISPARISSHFSYFNKGVVSTQHFHNEVELLVVNSGVFRCTSNDVEYVATEGDIYFINSRVPHATDSLTAGSSTSLIQFSPELFSDFPASDARYLSRFINISKEPVHIFKKGEADTIELSGYLNSIFSEYSNRKNSFELYIKSHLCAVTAFLSRNEILTDSSVFFNSKNIGKILPALKYIDENCTQPLTLEEVSATINLDQSYFCRLFKKTTNSTFTEYLNFVRICKSEKMLTSSDEGVADIAYRLGFSSVSYFNKIFRKYKNCTPTQYRKSKYLNQ